MGDVVVETHRCGGQGEESGVGEVPEVDQQQDVLSQLGRLDDSVRDLHGHGGGYVQTDCRVNHNRSLMMPKSARHTHTNSPQCAHRRLSL